ncbi:MULTISPECIES: CHAT domain-containing protein [unclassified Coleofasciculus]|uniref:CHAT domain-containing protein n=1 Tax=unclassified Coleofasciculus TaxID=2692782 RepID=UPI00187E926F|nr:MULTISPECIES: CHAT domain-containing protein [unclassified Coleofasciculus]MBE9127119.1 CHAT domain-containing protein [Coleofasciculus sp. LEGE 07081]MBE9149774.1 CHAT domain-containing protein [Coleofasciculus sp. LEGE 07092]
MTRKRHPPYQRLRSLFRAISPFDSSQRGRVKRLSRHINLTPLPPKKGWSWFLLALVVAFLCAVGSPTFAKAPSSRLPITTASSSLPVFPSPLKQLDRKFYTLALDSPVSQSPTAGLVEQGKTLYETGQFTQAVTVLQQAADAYQAQGDTLKQATVLSNLSLAYQQLGLWSQATDAISTSLALLQTEKAAESPAQRQRILAQSLDIQGRLQLTLGQTEQALVTWQQATALYRQLGNEVGEIKSQINQAQAMQVLGFYRRALALLNQVQQSLEAQPDSLTKAVGLRSLADVLLLVGDLPRSRETLEQSLQIARNLRSPQDTSAALLSLANTARQQQQTQEALDFYEQAAAASNSPTLTIQAQLNQLSFLVKTEKIQPALPLWRQIQTQLDDLPLSHPAIYSRINFAQTLIALKQYSENQSQELQAGFPDWTMIAQLLATASQQGKSLGDTRAQAYALGTLGGLYEQTNQFEEARELTQQASVRAQSIQALDILYLWQWQLGRLLNKQGDTQGAIAAYSGAVSTLQSLRSDLVAVNSDVQFSFQKGVEPIYRELVELLLPEDDSQIDPERLEQARQVIESLQLAELDNFFRTDCLSAKPVKIDTLDQQAAIIYPIVLQNRLEVILSLPQQPLRHYTTIIPQNQVESTLLELRKFLPQRTSRQYIPLAQEVYDWLIRPTEAALVESEVKTLVFVLNGSLRNIPMAALFDGEQYLLEKYAIALTPGLELLESKPLTQRDLRVLTAGLSESRGVFGALPNVERELKEIQDLMPGELLLNDQFTKTILQNTLDQGSFPIVHLATHGQFSSKAEGTFILTWDDRIDVNELNNLLETTDLRGSNPIELLVLSACETAKGDDRAALGIAGVAVRAGARSTLATLWLVDDEATSKLMVQFYDELTKETVTKAEALRHAQLAILQDPKYGRHPYYWAPFVFVGNWL